MFRRRRGGGRGGADPYTLMLLLQLGQQVVRLLDNNGNGNGRQSPPPIATLSLGFSMLAAYFSADLADAGLPPSWPQPSTACACSRDSWWRGLEEGVLLGGEEGGGTVPTINGRA